MEPLDRTGPDQTERAPLPEILVGQAAVETVAAPEGERERQTTAGPEATIQGRRGLAQVERRDRATASPALQAEALAAVMARPLTTVLEQVRPGQTARNGHRTDLGREVAPTAETMSAPEPLAKMADFTAVALPAVAAMVRPAAARAGRVSWS